ncbi:MAG: shikimate kinase [Acidobacteriia bacterium]|nr:shikimate kinase [Terriglobia bacterium]
MKPVTGSRSFTEGGTPHSGRPTLVFLVGFMGAGKTSVGRALGHRLGWSFEDLDDRIQQRGGRSIPEIFQASGEVEFRRMESAALRELLAEAGATPRIVALGGGAFAQQENVDRIQQAAATVVFLDGPAEELFRRCEQEQRERPLRRDLKQFRELYDQRRPVYLKATRRIDTQGKDVEKVAVEVACCLGLV